MFDNAQDLVRAWCTSIGSSVRRFIGYPRPPLAVVQRSTEASHEDGIRTADLEHMPDDSEPSFSLTFNADVRQGAKSPHRPAQVGQKSTEPATATDCNVPVRAASS